jgi:transcription elongation GreA/GreB family factor
MPLAFENDTTELPDRPISPDRNFVTEAALAEIEAELNRFEAAHRAASDSGAVAASLEIRYWGARRASVEVVKTLVDKGKASFGMTVTLRRSHHPGRAVTERAALPKTSCALAWWQRGDAHRALSPT